MKHLQVIAFCVVLTHGCFGQEVIASDGNYSSSSSGSLSWTIGEVVTETLEDNGVLTQGFQQPFPKYAGSVETEGTHFGFIYPNPFTTVLTFTYGDTKPGPIGIYDGRSRLITTIRHPQNMGNGNYKIDVSGLSSGVYFMQVGTETGNIHRIVKL